MSNPLDRLGDDVYTFVFEGKKCDVYPTKDIPIDDSNLSYEFSNQSSIYCYVALLSAKAENSVKICKMELEEAEATAYNIIRSEAEVRGVKLTEDAVKSRVVVNADVMGKKRKLVDNQGDLSILRALEDALKMRADMLIRLGMQAVAEWNQTGMNVKEDPAERIKRRLDNMKGKSEE